MNIRDISDQVLAEFERGKSREEVFQALQSKHPEQLGKIAYCIASTPDRQLRASYLKHNALLCLLLIAYAVLTLTVELPIEFDQPTIFILLKVSIPLIFLYFVYRFHGGVYRIAGIWALLDLLETLLLTGAPDGISAVRLMVVFFVVVLSFLLARKVFPNLRILGPKRDSSGNYLL